MFQSKRPPQAFISNQHPIAVGQSMCTAMPNRFVRDPTSKMYALSGVVCGAPPAVAAAFAYIGILKAQLCGGRCRCCLFAVPPACFPCVFFNLVFACGGGLFGLYEGQDLLNRQRLPTAAGVYQFWCWLYYVLIFLLCTPPVPPCAPWCTHPGSFSGTLSGSQFTTGTPTVGLEPTTTRLRALRSTD